jgi:hypothetical protein
VHSRHILAGTAYRARAWTEARRDSFFQTISGHPGYDPTKAHVHVHVDGMRRAELQLSASHSAPMTILTSAWAPGGDGKEVFFPNVEGGNGSTMLSVLGGGAIGTDPDRAQRLTGTDAVSRTAVVDRIHGQRSVEGRRGVSRLAARSG